MIELLHPSCTAISIHALLAESDHISKARGKGVDRFLSTLSLRRATDQATNTRQGQQISIHALLAESDAFIHSKQSKFWYFYPRSPCGERLTLIWDVIAVITISIPALLAESDSQSAHAPADAEKNVQSDWNETDGNSDAFIKNKPAIPKAVTKTVQTLSDAASKSFTVTGYILSVILIDSVTKEQVIGDVSFENATASANGKVTVTLAAAPSNPILVVITSIAL